MSPPRAPSTCTPLGALPPGPPSALALAGTGLHSFAFLAAPIGLWRAALPAALPSRSAKLTWQRMTDAPLGILSLAASPGFPRDQRVLAGAATGLWASDDAGQTWRAAPLPAADAAITALAFSPAYEDDGVIAAGTAEDGVLLSRDRGRTWQAANFGLLDALVFSLAFSPGFARDGTVFAGTDSALYMSYNGARAWKQLDLPEDVCPVLSVLASPAYGDDGVALAGTAGDGLYRTDDRGAHWARVDLPARSVNAVAAHDGRTSLAATDAGLFASLDGGRTWRVEIDRPDLVSIATGADMTLAGSAGHGAWATSSSRRWRSVALPSIRAVSGLALSPRIADDGRAFIFGPGESIWRTTDHGGSWQPLDFGEAPEAEVVRSLTVAAHPSAASAVVVATSAGISISEDGGEAWRRIAVGASDVVCSEPGGILAAALTSGPVLISADLGRTWTEFGAPWPGGRALAVAIGPNRHLRAVTYDAARGHVQLWHGAPGEVTCVFDRPWPRPPLTCLWSTPQTWFASVADTIWRVDVGREASTAQVGSSADLGERADVVALAGVEGDPVELFACTSRRLLRSTGGGWSQVHAFGEPPAIGLQLSPSFARDRTAYALLLGGASCRIRLPAQL